MGTNYLEFVLGGVWGLQRGERLHHWEPFWGTNLLGFSIGRDMGALKRLKQLCDSQYTIPVLLIESYTLTETTAVVLLDSWLDHTRRVFRRYACPSHRYAWANAMHGSQNG